MSEAEVAASAYKPFKAADALTATACKDFIMSTAAAVAGGEAPKDTSTLAGWLAERAGLDADVSQNYAAELSAKGITSLADLLAKPMAQWGIQIKAYDSPKILNAVRDEIERNSGSA